MARKRIPTRYGFTFTEIIIAIAASVVVIAGVVVVLVDSQNGWHRMYNRVYGDVVTNSYVARKRFNAVIRSASREKFLVDDDGNWLEVYYYADGDSTVIDRYARFYLSGDELKVEYGNLDPAEALSTQTVCENVSDCIFRKAGRSAQMILTLDNESQTIAIVSSAVMHNR